MEHFVLIIFPSNFFEQSVKASMNANFDQSEIKYFSENLEQPELCQNAAKWMTFKNFSNKNVIKS